MEDLGIAQSESRFPIPLSKLNVTLYHSVLGKQLWAPLRYSHGGLFYGEKANLNDFVERFVREVKPLRNDVEVRYYDFTGQELSPSPGFAHYTVKRSLKSLLLELKQQQEELQKLRIAKKKLELNKRASVLLIHLTPREQEELHDRETLALALESFQWQDERLFPIFIAQYAELTPNDFMAALHWGAYLGVRNEGVLRYLYPTYSEELYSVNRELMGLLYLEGAPNLIPLHDVLFKPSAYKVEKDRVAELEEEAYKKFLDSL